MESAFGRSYGILEFCARDRQQGFGCFSTTYISNQLGYHMRVLHKLLTSDFCTVISSYFHLAFHHILIVLLPFTIFYVLVMCSYYFQGLISIRDEKGSETSKIRKKSQNSDFPHIKSRGLLRAIAAKAPRVSKLTSLVL